LDAGWQPALSARSVPFGIGRRIGHALRELDGKDGRERLAEMRDTDPVAGAIVTAIELLCCGVPWSTEPVDESATAQEEAEFVEGVFDDMSHSFDDALTDAMSMTTFGWSFLETVYKRRVGPEEVDPVLRSKFTDGRIGIRKLVGRSQLTLKEWLLDDSGGVQAFVQESEKDPKGIPIPIERGLLFRTAREMGSPEGRPVLRSAWLSYRARRHLEGIAQVGHERELAGLPVVDAPLALLSPIASDAAAEAARLAAFNEWKQVARDLKFNEQGAIIIPSDPYKDAEGKPTGDRMYNVRLMTTGGTRSMDIGGEINRLADDIFRSALAGFLRLGANKTGSFALSKDQSDLFVAAITWFVDVIEDTINRHLLPRLWSLNALDPRLMPKMKHGEVATVDLEQIGSFVQKISGAGIPLAGDRETENTLRRMGKLPEVTEEMFDEREAQEERDREMQLEAQQAEVDALRAKKPTAP
jgi:hypothetical protein